MQCCLFGVGDKDGLIIGRDVGVSFSSSRYLAEQREETRRAQHKAQQLQQQLQEKDSQLDDRREDIRDISTGTVAVVVFLKLLHSTEAAFFGWLISNATLLVASQI